MRLHHPQHVSSTTEPINVLGKLLPVECNAQLTPHPLDAPMFEHGNVPPHKLLELVNPELTHPNRNFQRVEIAAQRTELREALTCRNQQLLDNGELQSQGLDVFRSFGDIAKELDEAVADATSIAVLTKRRPSVSYHWRFGWTGMLVGKLISRGRGACRFDQAK